MVCIFIFISYAAARECINNTRAYLHGRRAIIHNKVFQSIFMFVQMCFLTKLLLFSFFFETSTFKFFYVIKNVYHNVYSMFFLSQIYSLWIESIKTISYESIDIDILSASRIVISINTYE